MTALGASGTDIYAQSVPDNPVREIAQSATNTIYDRHPQIFRVASAVVTERRLRRGANILSFGCSSGEEALALAEKYFMQAEDRILGVDISGKQLTLARAANRQPQRISFEISEPQTLRAHGPFDAIFAMTVLCAWPAADKVEDISTIFSFARFSALVAELDRHLQIGGLLVIYNANFRFRDTETAGRYRVISTGSNNSGFVYKFDKMNRRRPEYDFYRDIIFEKRAAGWNLAAG